MPPRAAESARGTDEPKVHSEFPLPTVSPFAPGGPADQEPTRFSTLLRLHLSDRWLHAGQTSIAARGLPVAAPAASPEEAGRKETETDLASRLLAVTRRLASCSEREELLREIARGALCVIPCGGAFAGIVDSGHVSSGPYARAAGTTPFQREWRPGEGLPGWVLSRKSPYLTNDPSADGLLDADIANRFRVRSALAVPIADGSHLLGVLELHNHRSPGGFGVEDTRLAMEVARSAAIALQTLRRLSTALSQAPSDAKDTDPLHAQRLQAVGRLTGGIAHDFNNFLTVVLGGTDLLLEKGGGGSDAREIAEIREAALRARFLTSRLLAFSRSAPMETEAVDVTRGISEMARLLRRLVGADVVVRKDLVGALPCVAMAPGQLDQILVNLAINARDAMPDGGYLTIRSRHERENGFVRIEVEDTGTGMDEATRRRIFDPFFTTKGAGEGTGLGLATVSEIVKELGGRVGVRSTPGEGTTFEVYLPAASEEPHESTATAPANAPPRPNVLLVEDDPSVRRLVKRVLERRGLQVLQAANGAEGLALMEEHVGPIDLLMTDVMLPDIGGIELWDRLGSRIEGGKTIFLSGYLEDDLPAVPVSRNEVEFLPKPFAVDELVRLVDAVFAQE